MLSHSREWMATPGARYPPGQVLEQLRAPTPGVRNVLHRAPAPTEQLTDEVLDLALEPPPGSARRPTFRVRARRTTRPARRVEAAYAGGVMEQWLALHNPSTAQGLWYPHQLLFLSRAAPVNLRQNPYHTHPESLGAQGFPQLAPPPLPPGQGQEALLQGPLLDTNTTVQ